MHFRAQTTAKTGPLFHLTKNEAFRFRKME